MFLIYLTIWHCLKLISVIGVERIINGYFNIPHVSTSRTLFLTNILYWLASMSCAIFPCWVSIVTSQYVWFGWNDMFKCHKTNSRIWIIVKKANETTTTIKRNVIKILSAFQFSMITYFIASKSKIIRTVTAEQLSRIYE